MPHRGSSTSPVAGSGWQSVDGSFAGGVGAGMRIRAGALVAGSKNPTGCGGVWCGVTEVWCYESRGSRVCHARIRENATNLRRITSPERRTMCSNGYRLVENRSPAAASTLLAQCSALAVRYVFVRCFNRTWLQRWTRFDCLHMSRHAGSARFDTPRTSTS